MFLTMVSKISSFIIFIIIVFANGNPAYRQDSYEERQHNLKHFLQNIVKQGHCDDILNRPEDRRGHREAITRMTSRFYEKYRNSDNYNDERDNLNYQNQLNSQTLNLFLNKLRSLKTEEKKDCMKNWESCVEIVWNDTVSNIPPKTDKEREDGDQLRQRKKKRGRRRLRKITNSENCGVLPELDVNDELELRCYGYRCGESTDDGDRNSGREFSGNKDYKYNIVNKNNDRHQRCNGKSCSLERDNDMRDRDSLRYYGNKCSRKTRHDDRGQIYDGKNRIDTKDDNYDDRDRLQCIWDRFGRDRTPLEKDLNFIEKKYSGNLNMSDIKYIVDEYVVKELDRKLDFLFYTQHLKQEVNNAIYNEQTENLVEQLRKGLLELLDFHFGQERKPNDSYFKNT